MASRSTELNLYRKFSTKIRLLGADIWFLKSCKANSVYPSFIKVDIPKSNVSDKVEKIAKQKWLDLEIKFLYSKRSMLEIEAYGLYKKLTYKLTNVEYECWCLFQRNMFVVINSKFVKKMSILNNKFKKLKSSKNKHVFQRDINIVENLSSQTFDKQELSLLNKGLKYALPNSGSALEEIVVGVETAIQHLPEASKVFTREACRNQLSKNIVSSKSLKSNKEHNIVKSLRNKDCFYLKADKGNKVVILDKKDYYDKVNNLIDNGPYINLKKNPLSKMVADVKKTLKECNTLIDLSLKRKLQVSNPSLPKLYALPKIHKPDKSMRPIVSAVGSPTYNLAKWLSREFENLPDHEPSFSVKNNIEFINKIKDITLHEGEILVSFDVSSLFPSVPIPHTLGYLKELLNANGLDNKTVIEYIELTSLCMKQNCFQFNNNFFEQREGTAMGNPLSPFLANLFMSRFEVEAKNQFEYFPRVWFRYVDDIFAVFDTHSDTIDNFISKLNNRFPSIKFTHEIENNDRLPFLDVLVIRNTNNCLEFDIYRKNTTTRRYIPNESHHSVEHKMASLNFLVHRLLSFPLSNERYEIERDYIRNVAECNGYSPSLVDKLIRKRRYRLMISENSTFQVEKDTSKYFSIPFDRELSRGLKGIFKNVNYKLVYSANNKLQQLLGNPKDKTPPLERSGIYEISCKDCNQKYVGQTRRSILTRFKEHLAQIRYGRPDKSCVAEHIVDNEHCIDLNNLKLIKQVSNYRQLDAYESIRINKCKDSMNRDNGPIPSSSLFLLL